MARLTWSARRQLLYYGVALVVALGLAWWGYQTFFTAAPTCFDKVQNQGERGVDCGGPCSLVCSADTKQSSVLWAGAFAVASSTYSAAAYLETNNPTAAAKAVPYSFQLFDASNALVVERDGVVDIPPIKTMPIVEVNIDTGNRAVTHALFSLGGQPVWRVANVPVLRAQNEQLASDGSRLTADIANDTLSAVKRATVDAVLFNAQGTAIAASKSVIDVPAKGKTPVIFTWPGGTQGVVRAELTVLPPL